MSPLEPPETARNARTDCAIVAQRRTSPGLLTQASTRVRVATATMKMLAIDFGERRVGTAICDPDETFAIPLLTLERRNDSQVVAELAELARSEGVETLLLGEPRRMDGSRGAAADRAASVARKLGEATGLPVVLVDEGLTSREAESRLREAGVDIRTQPGRVDAVAAQILLEDTIARRRRADG